MNSTLAPKSRRRPAITVAIRSRPSASLLPLSMEQSCSSVLRRAGFSCWASDQIGWRGAPKTRPVMAASNSSTAGTTKEPSLRTITRTVRPIFRVSARLSSRAYNAARAGRLRHHEGGNTMEVTSRLRDGVVILDLTGDLVGDRADLALRGWVQRVLDEGATKILIN